MNIDKQKDKILANLATEMVPNLSGWRKRIKVAHPKGWAKLKGLFLFYSSCSRVTTRSLSYIHLQIIESLIIPTDTRAAFALMINS